MMDSIRIATEEFKKEWELVKKQHEHDFDIRDIESYGSVFWHSLALRLLGELEQSQREGKELRGEVRDLQEKGVSLTDDEQG
jgi:hypothetical protein